MVRWWKQLLARKLAALFLEMRIPLPLDLRVQDSGADERCGRALLESPIAIRIRLVLSVLGLSAGLFGCISVSDPLADDPAGPEVGAAHSTNSSETLTSDLESPASTFDEPALRWNELTRLARAHQMQGKFELAEQRLEQAATQVSALPPHHARRRTVFGMRARLAESLADRGELERADALAGIIHEIAGSVEIRVQFGRT